MQKQSFPRFSRFNRLALRCIAPVFALALSLDADSAFAVSCGDSIHLQSQEVTLDNDLLCANSPALTIVGPGTFDMKGHTVTCLLFNTNDGLRLEGKKAQVKNGEIRSCRTGMIVDGTGQHRVENLVVQNSAQRGIVITSTKNVLKAITSQNNGQDGFDISEAGKGNTITDSQAIDNGGHGFAVGSVLFPGSIDSKVVLKDNLAHNNDESGFWVLGNQHRLDGNTATGNGDHGIAIHEDRNTIKKNTATGNNAVGINISGVKNIVTDNTAIDNTSHGFLFSGFQHKAQRNTSHANGEAGVRTLNTAHSSYSKTVSLDNAGTDLHAGPANCGSQVWEDNVFGSSKAGAVTNPDCIQ